MQHQNITIVEVEHKLKLLPSTGIAGGHRDAVRGHGAVQEVQLEGRRGQKRGRRVGHMNFNSLS